MRRIARLASLLIILFQAITLLKAIQILRVSTCFRQCSSCVKHVDSASASFERVMWMYKGNLNSASGENWEKTSSSTIPPEASFNGDGNEKTLNLNKTCSQ